jgi:peptidoglycan/LPS O-acetylase OafA/YrhL
VTTEGVRAEPIRTASTRGPGVPHAPGLDGLRGLAVLAVLAYHLDLAWASGGFLGVEVFFTLSGFLITQLLVVDVRRTGTVDVGAFLRARARRLLPALVTCVTATVVTYRLMLPADAPGLRWDALASLAYVQNWQLMLGGMPYSEAFARPSPLLHLWSLSVEGQLYVLWPLLFVGVLAVQRRASVVVVALGLALVSAVVLAVGYTPDGGELIYYATPARASGFLVGAALAVAWRPEAWSRPLPRVVDAALGCAGLVAVVTVVLAFVTASEFDAALFDRGGFLRTGLASAVVILAATRQGIVTTVLSGRLLSGAGRRSYGLYLYHWPVFVLCRDVAVPEWLRITLCLALTYTVTEVSYCWLEMPIRRGGLRTAARVLRLPRPAATGALAAVTAGVVTVVVASTGVPTGLDGDPVTDGPTAIAAPVAVSVAASGPDGADAAPPPATEPDTERSAPAAVPTTGDPGPGLVVGDSIALGSAGALRAVLGGDTTVDAKVGRQFAASPAIVAAWTRAHRGPVVIALGANGTVSRRDLDAVLAAAGSRRVVLVGVAVARRWRDGNNAVLRAAAGAPQVAFVDWAALVAANPGTLGPDGVHPGPRGRALLAGAVADAIGRDH